MVYPYLDELERLHQHKLVYKRPHPTLPLFIYNYTRRAQSIKPAEWPKPLLDARGLVLNWGWEIVGRGFEKFFGIQEAEVPDGLYDVYDKLDGTLILVMHYQGQRVITTRGSFGSPEAQWAAKWFEENHPDFVPARGQTYCFEGIFPEKQLAVDYQNTRDCTLLAVLDEHGTDIDDVFDSTTRFRKVRKVAASIAKEDLRTFFEDQENFEGYVIRLLDGRQPPARFKIKLETYRKVCRAITNLNTNWLYQRLKSDELDAIERVRQIVPSLVRNWIDEQTCCLNQQFVTIVNDSKQALEEARQTGVYENDQQFSQWVFEHYKELSAVLFEIRKHGDRFSRKAVWSRVQVSNKQPTILEDL